ncbi:MAG: SirB2 family protein [Pseudohongiellaceae bacterium]|nr:SirB2 family protein [Pseudohongiellaceae bacterium]
MTTYMFIKIIHMTCAMISIVGFATRGVLKIQGSAVLEKKLVKVLPHVIDTVLLASAIVLVVMSGQYPFATPWVTAKLLGLIVYIGLGVVLMKKAKTKQSQIITFVLALVTIGYILMVATRKVAF